MPAWYGNFRSPILLLQSVLGVFLFAYSLRRRPHFKARVALGLLLGGATLHLLRQFFPDAPTHVNSVGRIVLTMAAYLILILVCWAIYEESFWTAMFVAASGFIAQDMGGTLKTLFKLYPPVLDLALNDFGILLVDLVCYLGFYVILYFAFRPFTANREENFDNRTKALFSAAALLFGLGMARLTQGDPARSSLAVFAESLYQIMCGAFILLLQFGVMERARLNRNVCTMQEVVRQQHEQFCLAKENTALVNEKYHDLKNLLESFQGQVPQAQIDALKEKIHQYDVAIATGNYVLDVVLTEKRTQCVRHGIELTTLVDGASLSFVEELELYSIVNDALNNAIEAVLPLPESERYINFFAACEDGMATFHVENPYAGELVMRGHLPQSQRDARYHGFGMRSMERTAEKYNGSLAVKAEDGKFCLDLLLFAP